MATNQNTLEQLNEEFFALMNAPPGSELKPPVEDKILQEMLMYFVDAAHHARLVYIKARLSND